MLITYEKQFIDYDSKEELLKHYNQMLNNGFRIENIYGYWDNKSMFSVEYTKGIPALINPYTIQNIDKFLKLEG